MSSITLLMRVINQSINLKTVVIIKRSMTLLSICGTYIVNHYALMLVQLLATTVCMLLSASHLVFNSIPCLQTSIHDILVFIILDQQHNTVVLWIPTLHFLHKVMLILYTVRGVMRWVRLACRSNKACMISISTLETADKAISTVNIHHVTDMTTTIMNEISGTLQHTDTVKKFIYKRYIHQRL